MVTEHSSFIQAPSVLECPHDGQEADQQKDLENKEIIMFKKGQIQFQNSESTMIVIKNITQLVKYERVKIENHFYEMLTATVSHEMRTPLNAIISLLYSLEHHLGHSPQGKKLLRIIQNSSKILLFLVNDMLDIFQIKNGKFHKTEKEVILRDTFLEI